VKKLNAVIIMLILLLGWCLIVTCLIMNTGVSLHSNPIPTETSMPNDYYHHDKNGGGTYWPFLVHPYIP